MSTRRTSPVGRLAHRVSAYDLVLFVLPLPTLLGVVSGAELGQWVGPLVSAAILGHALFVAPPDDATGRSE
ncbi:MAG: hypothetical protein V5A31_00460 [Haloferacaceae archaeon]|jgi:hypothetical protein